MKLTNELKNQAVDAFTSAETVAQVGMIKLTGGIGLGFVLGFKAGLFAGRAVLDVKDFSAPEQGVFRFHNWIICFDIPVRYPQRFLTPAVAKFQQVLASFGELFYHPPHD